jgi:hypothetical protein
LNNSRTVAVIAAVVLALGVSLYIPVGAPGSSATSPIPDGVTATGSNGLQLQLSVNSSQVTRGHAMGVRVAVWNTLDVPNNASAANAWPFDVQAESCPHGFYPMGVALFEGRVGAGNVSGATPLQIFPDTPCPLFVRFISGYLFQPASGSAIVLPGTGPQVLIAANVTVSGTFSTGPQPQALTPGVYTIASADEWGVAVFLYVQVA